tara:strand:- start:8560 stop:8748 length:189 start_codon:yes stop_codon:yes gene_type:complete
MDKDIYSYAIIKQTSSAKHLLTYGDEIFETDTLSEVSKLVTMLNENSDNNCTYEIFTIPKKN